MVWKTQVKIIEVCWDGPYKMKDIKGKSGITDYGVYQIYGTHPVSGPDSLLYVGKADEQTFEQRISQHMWWTDWEPSEVQIYLGRLGGSSKVSTDEWSNLIDQAEKLLIYSVNPPYNARLLSDYGEINYTVVLNLGRRNRLPAEVSTLDNDSEIGNTEGKWEVFSL